jgi:Flp pilus assembly protein TadG
VRLLRRLGRDARGVSAVEFALVATPLFVTLFALVDLGFRQYMQVQLEGTLDQAARKVTVGGVTTATIQSFVEGRMKRILPGATVVVTPKGYNDFSDVAKPEPITTDTAPLGTFNTGDCYLDMNNNNVWDADGGSTSITGGDDIIYYTATATFRAIMPLGKWLGWGANRTVTSTIAIRNQPYAAQPQPVTKCT